LCFRFKERERLQTASSFPIPGSESAEKRKKFEQYLPYFRGGLIRVRDMQREHFTSRVCKFGHHGQQAKADVRRKIGDAVILKYPMVGDTDFAFLRANRRKLS